MSLEKGGHRRVAIIGWIKKEENVMNVMSVVMEFHTHGILLSFFSSDNWPLATVTLLGLKYFSKFLNFMNVGITVILSPLHSSRHHGNKKQ